MTELVIQTHPVGDLATNCYLIADPTTEEALIVDPGDTHPSLLQAIKGWKIRAIVLTHGHADHIGGVPAVQAASDAPIFISADDLPLYESPAKNLSLLAGRPLELPPVERLLVEGDSFTLGSHTFSIMLTPGHSPGSLLLVGEHHLFAGDTLFAGSVGRWDFPGGSEEALMHSLDRILTLSDSLEVYPGHGPKTRLAEEKVSNPYLIMRQRFG